mgnify:CR=1 FL=1
MKVVYPFSPPWAFRPDRLENPILIRISQEQKTLLYPTESLQKNRSL